jgi:hypothetical protein
MAHTISERQIRMFWRRVGQEELRRTEPQRRRATIEAKIAVAAFNGRARSAHPVLAWPTFRAAVPVGASIFNGGMRILRSDRLSRLA